MPERQGLEALPGLLLPWYRAHARRLPWRDSPTPYAVLVSEIMLQQTRVEAALPYFERFMAELPDFEALAGADEAQLLKLWQGLGYYSRARNLQKAAQLVVQRHGGQLPADLRALRALPGVGDYTAGAVASIAFGLPAAAVDGNVLRVFARLLCSGESLSSPAFKKEVARRVEGLMPKGQEGDFTQALMELGATVCLPNGRPLCEACPVRELCGAACEGRQQELPVRQEKKARRREQKAVLLLCAGELTALRRRPDRGLLAGLWEPVTLPGTPDEAQVRRAVEEMGGAVRQLVPLPAAKHVFTHVEWHMTGWRVELESARGLDPSLVFTMERQRREQYAVPSAYRAYLKPSRRR